jgi:hypothetical protein
MQLPLFVICDASESRLLRRKEVNTMKIKTTMIIFKVLKLLEESLKSIFNLLSGS